MSLRVTTETGWQPKGAIDLRATDDEPGTCDRCGQRDLRILHTEEGQLHVGSESAKRLCWGYDPCRVEKRLNNLWSRRSRWLTRNWGMSWNGNDTLMFRHTGETVRVTIFINKFGQFMYCVSIDGNPFYSSQSFAEADVAKLAAFDRIAVELKW